MSDQPETKFYVSSGEARLVCLAMAPAVAALNLLLRVLRDSFAVQFGKTVYVSQQGYRDEQNADDGTAQFDSYLVFLCSGIVNVTTSREQFEKFFLLQGGQQHGNQDESTD